MYFHILFLEATVMYNLDDFIKLCFEKNTSHFLKQNFESRELLKILEKTLQDKDFKNTINRYIKLNKNNEKSKDLIYNNLRMTCVENYF